MDSLNEELTLENVDEQIEQYLGRSQELWSPTVTPLTRTVQNLHYIYGIDDRRLEDVWGRINSRAAIRGEQVQALTLQDTHRESLNIVLHKSGTRLRQPFRRSWYTVGIGLAAAVILIIYFAWPLVSYALHGSWMPNPRPPIHKDMPQIQLTANGAGQNEPTITPTAKSTIRSTAAPTPVATVLPTATPTPNVLPSIQVYSGQYFTIQYPADWVITGVTTGNGYVQTVQFRPSATSSVYANVNVLHQSSLTAELLLLADTDLKQGTVQSISSVIYHGTAWEVGMVELSTTSPASEFEIAYSNQGTPYRIEFSAPSAMFGDYAPIFNAMFASFSSKN